MSDLETRATPLIATSDVARRAQGPEETSGDDTLLPILMGGLVLVVIGMIVVTLLG